MGTWRAVKMRVWVNGRSNPWHPGGVSGMRWRWVVTNGESLAADNDGTKKFSTKREASAYAARTPDDHSNVTRLLPDERAAIAKTSGDA